ncbi:MAG: transposase [Glaciimonas sp.]|nr:transposase [Glaciimonas sp.]
MARSDEQELELLSVIDAEYTRYPFFGIRKIKHYLRGLRYTINRKRVQRLMRILGLAGMRPDPISVMRIGNTRIYPYLLIWSGGNQTKSGLEYRHYLYSSATRICILGFSCPCGT